MRLSRLRAILFRRPRYRVTRGGALFLLALALTGAGAFLSGNNLIFLMFAAMLALLMVSGFISRLSLAGLELELLLPEHVSARAQAPARIRIRNLKRFSASWSIEVSGRPQAGAGTPPILTAPVYFPYIGGRSSVEAAVNVLFPRRGRHGENLFVLSTRFPFGFIRHSAGVVLHHVTVVYPALEPHPEMEALVDEIAGAAEARTRGASDDFYRIRPYESGDDARHTHWKSTARTGNIHVREFGREERRPAEIRFDRNIEAGEESEFEAMIERCAFLVWELARRGVDVIFRTGDTALTISGGEGVYDILMMLSLTEPCLTGNSAPPGHYPDECGPQVVFSVRRRRTE